MFVVLLGPVLSFANFISAATFLCSAKIHFRPILYDGDTRDDNKEKLLFIASDFYGLIGQFC